MTKGVIEERIPWWTPGHLPTTTAQHFMVRGLVDDAAVGVVAADAAAVEAAMDAVAAAAAVAVAMALALALALVFLMASALASIRASASA